MEFVEIDKLDTDTLCLALAGRELAWFPVHDGIFIFDSAEEEEHFKSSTYGRLLREALAENKKLRAKTNIVEDLKRLGYTCQELKDFGVKYYQLSEYYDSFWEVYSIDEMLTQGADLEELRFYFSLDDLSSYYSVKELFDVTLECYTEREWLEEEYPLAETLSCIKDNTLKHLFEREYKKWRLEQNV